MIDQGISIVRYIVVLLCSLTAPAIAQTAAARCIPERDPPYYRVRYEASDRPGELRFAVNYTIWVPKMSKRCVA